MKLNDKTNIAIILVLGLTLFFGAFQLVNALTKPIGATFTIKANCSDPDGNLTLCKVTSPCINNCSAPGFSGSCSCNFLCTVPGTYNACGEARDTLALTATQCLSNVICNWPPDTTPPQVDSFDVQPRTLTIAQPTATISWTVTDAGGSHLDHVEVWRSGGPPPGAWAQIGPNYNAPADSDFWTSSAFDSPSDDGIYWYGIHVFDKAGNWWTEMGPIMVTVDKTPPPKPICNPGTGSYPSSVTVTCSDTEAGVTIRYTTNGTAPTTGSTQYTSALTFTSNTTLTVTAWDSVGNRSNSPDNQYIYTIGPWPDTIIDSGPPNPTNQTTATFNFHGINSPTSYQCQIDGGVFAVCTSPKSYTLIQGTHTFRVKAINVFGEDPTPASFTWLLDTTLPQVNSFDVQPRTLTFAQPTATISWTVTDAGGSHLDHVEVWRAPDSGGVPGAWAKIGPNYNAPADSDSWTSSALDSPSDDGIYWYGLHVLDKAGNMGTEPAPIKVTVDKTKPPSAAISCQIVACKGPGCQCNASWVTFNGTGVIYRINNNSTDPDNNIISSTWSIIGYQDPYLTCSAPNPLCNLTMPRIPSGNYTIKLKAQDAGGLSNETSHSIRVKQDAVADFDCSLDGINWKNCGDLRVDEGQLVYLKDKSLASEDADITSRTWKLNNVIFDSDNNVITSVNVSGSPIITLDVLDSQGRSSTKEYVISARPPLPQYREIPPVIWLKKFFSSIGLALWEKFW